MHTLPTVLEKLKKGLDNLQKSILSNIRKTCQFVCKLRFRIRGYPSGVLFLPHSKPCCQECKSQLRQLKYRALQGQWIIVRYKAKVGKGKCCQLLAHLKSQVEPIM